MPDLLLMRVYVCDWSDDTMLAKRASDHCIHPYLSHRFHNTPMLFALFRSFYLCDPLTLVYDMFLLCTIRGTSDEGVYVNKHKKNSGYHNKYFDSNEIIICILTIF